MKMQEQKNETQTFREGKMQEWKTGNEQHVRQMVMIRYSLAPSLFFFLTVK